MQSKFGCAVDLYEMTWEVIVGFMNVDVYLQPYYQLYEAHVQWCFR